MKIFVNYIQLLGNCHDYLASMGRENEASVREKSVKSQGILKAYMSGNPVLGITPYITYQGAIALKVHGEKRDSSAYWMPGGKQMTNIWCDV